MDNCKACALDPDPWNNVTYHVCTRAAGCRERRALALLDRVGDAAADAIIKGEAAVVPVEATRLMVLDGDASFWESDDTHNTGVAWSAMLAAGRLDRVAGAGGKEGE
jgi:hypothetical protein